MHEWTSCSRWPREHALHQSAPRRPVRTASRHLWGSSAAPRVIGWERAACTLYATAALWPPRGAACRPAWSRSSWIGFHWSHFAPSQSGTEPAGGEAGHSKNWCLASRLPAGSANPRSALFIQMSSAGVELVQLRCWTVLMQQTCVLVWKRYQMKTSWQIFPLGSFSNERKFIFSNNVLRFLLENGPNFFDDGCFQTTFPVLNKKFTKI